MNSEIDYIAIKTTIHFSFSVHYLLSVLLFLDSNLIIKKKRLLGLEQPLDDFLIDSCLNPYSERLMGTSYDVTGRPAQ